MNIFTLALMILSAPLIVLGATVSPPSDFKGFVKIITDLIKILVVLTFALTFLAFLWGVVKNWIINGGSADGVESGKRVVGISIIVFVIIISIWGILAILKSSFFGS
jgi:hypothetical protein